MYHIPDSAIPTVRAPNPILEERARIKLAKAELLFLPGIPLPVANRAQRATGTGATIVQVVGLLIKLYGKNVVEISRNIAQLTGLSDYQLKHGLKALSDAGIVRVHSKAGRRRRIELIDAEYLKWLGVES